MYVQTVLNNREVKWPIQNVKNTYQFSFVEGAVRGGRWKRKLGIPNLVMKYTVPTSLLQLPGLFRVTSVIRSSCGHSFILYFSAFK